MASFSEFFSFLLDFLLGKPCSHMSEPAVVGIIMLLLLTLMFLLTALLLFQRKITTIEAENEILQKEMVRLQMLILDMIDTVITDSATSLPRMTSELSEHEKFSQKLTEVSKHETVSQNLSDTQECKNCEITGRNEDGSRTPEECHIRNLSHGSSHSSTEILDVYSRHDLFKCSENLIKSSENLVRSSECLMKRYEGGTVVESGFCHEIHSAPKIRMSDRLRMRNLTEIAK